MKTWFLFFLNKQPLKLQIYKKKKPKRLNIQKLKSIKITFTPIWILGGKKHDLRPEKQSRSRVKV